MPKETRKPRADTARRAEHAARRAQGLPRQPFSWPTHTDVSQSLAALAPDLPCTFSFDPPAAGGAREPIAFDWPLPPPPSPPPSRPLTTRTIRKATPSSSSSAARLSSPSAAPTLATLPPTLLASMPIVPIVVRLDARGTRMSTSHTTLANAPAGTLLHRIAAAAAADVIAQSTIQTASPPVDTPRTFAPCVAQEDGSYFVDVNGVWLSVILDYLAHGIVAAPDFGPTIVMGVQAAAGYLGLHGLASECAARLTHAEAAEESIDRALAELSRRVACIEGKAAPTWSRPNHFFSAPPDDGRMRLL